MNESKPNADTPKRASSLHEADRKTSPAISHAENSGGSALTELRKHFKHKIDEARRLYAFAHTQRAERLKLYYEKDEAELARMLQIVARMETEAQNLFVSNQ